MRLIDREEVTARVFVGYYPGLEELHIVFQDEDYQGCKELVDSFRSLGTHVESDGFSVTVSTEKKK